MANYQRYQTLSSAEQYLFSPSCPVWVSRYQISWDIQTGGRLLQCRMVNLSDKAITAVYLRVLCRDAQGQDITTLHLVPVTGLYLIPGEVFGDDKVISLWPNRTAFAEVFPERVCFSDGTAWNEPAESDYLAIPAPAPVQREDRAYAKLVMAAHEGGVRNDCYFRQLKQLWQCTCGVPNANTTLKCRHCGADRAWLEQHMDAEALFAPKPAPAPPKPEPKPAPEPEPTPIEAFDLASYLAAEPDPRPTPAPREEFPLIRTEREPEPAPAPAQKSHAGRIVAIVLAIALFLGVGVWFAYQQFFGPYLRYQEAAAAENSGDYETAIALYTALGDYEDSPARIVLCQAQIALDQMRQGDYATAYETLKGLAGYESYAADCVYSQGVLAYNEGDLDGAWGFVTQLETAYPDYENLQGLRERCCYGFGKRYRDAALAAATDDEIREAYLLSKEWFLAAGDYSNSAEMVQNCDYSVAALLADEAQAEDDAQAFLEAAEAFAALDGFSDSASRRQTCLYEYCVIVADLGDTLCAQYLEELADAGYPGAEELLNSLTVFQTEIEVFFIDSGKTGRVRSELPLDMMGKVGLRYEISGGSPSASMQILMMYTLPGCPAGSIILNPDNSRKGETVLYAVIPVKATEGGDASLLFYDANTGEELYKLSFTLTTEEE